MKTPKKYWLGGVSISIIIFAIILFLYLLIKSRIQLPNWLFWPVIMALAVPFGGKAFLPNDDPMNEWLAIVIQFITYMIAGGLLGWVYGKIKKQ